MLKERKFGKCTGGSFADGIADDEAVALVDGVAGVILDVAFDCGCSVDTVGIVDDGCICSTFVVVDEDLFVVVGAAVADVSSGVNLDLGFVADVLGVSVWLLAVVVRNSRSPLVVKGTAE